MPTGINSVTIGTCTGGQITVTADITFPSNAVTKSANAIIVNSSNAAVCDPFPLNQLGGDIYVGTKTGIPPGNNYKAQAFANWTLPPVSGGDNKLSTNTSTCPMPSPPPPPPPSPPVPPSHGPKKPHRD